MLRRMVLVGLIGALLLGVAAFAAEEPVTITFWHAMSSRHQPNLQVLVDAFMAEYPYITVEMTYQGSYGDVENKTEAAVVAGTPPTIVQLYENVITPLVDALYPVGPTMTQAEVDDIIDGLIPNNTFDGVLTTVPFNKSIMVLYYREDLVTTVPTTWQEFFDVAKELTVDLDGDGVIDRYGTGLRPYNPEMYLNYLVQNGGSILNADWTAVTINEQPGIEAMEYAASLVPYSLISSGYLSDAFGANQVCMFIDTSAGYFYNNAAAEGAGFTMGVARVPAGPVNQQSAIQGTNLAVFSLGQTQGQMEAGALLCRFLLRPENTAFWAIKGGYQPVTKSAYNTQLWIDFVAANDYQVPMSEQMLDGFAQILHPNYGDMRGAIGTAFEEVLLGATGAVDAVNNLAAELDALLDD